MNLKQSSLMSSRQYIYNPPKKWEKGKFIFQTREKVSSSATGGRRGGYPDKGTLKVQRKLSLSLQRLERELQKANKKSLFQCPTSHNIWQIFFFFFFFHAILAKVFFIFLLHFQKSICWTLLPITNYICFFRKSWDSGPITYAP